MIFLKQVLTEAGYQGALVGMRRDATEADVTARIQSVLDARQISQSSIVVANGNYSSLSGGDVFAIRVGAPASANRITPVVISSIGQIESVVSTVKQ